MNKVGIILVNYNGYQITLECIHSLLALDYPNYTIYVVDNHSTHEQDKQLSKLDSIIYLQSENNGGFAYGNNIGIKRALQDQCDFIMLLNNDTEVEPDFLSILLKDFDQDQQIGITSPKILNFYQPNKIWSYGGTINWQLYVGYNDYTNQENRNLESGYTEFINGCCMLIKREVFLKIGLLPEEYFMYYEDLDYCEQVKKAYKLYRNNDAIIYHKVSATSEENSPFQLEWVTRSQLRFRKKHLKNKSIFSTLNIFLRKYLRIIQYTLKGDKPRKEAIKKGLDLSITHKED